MIPAAARLPEVYRLVEDQLYFVVHAPRQTGKTTTLQALSKEISARGNVAMLHFSCEVGQAAGDDFRTAQRMILEDIRQAAAAAFPVEWHPPDPWELGDDARSWC